MLHSNRQEQIKKEEEREEKPTPEMEYAELNKQFIREKQALLREMKDNQSAEGDQKKEDFRKSVKNYCCFFTIIIVFGSIFLIYYFGKGIIGPLQDDLNKKKGQVIEMVPQGKDELKQSLDQGAGLYDETKKTIDDLQNKYDKAKDTINKVTDTVDQVKKAGEDIQNAVK